MTITLLNSVNIDHAGADVRTLSLYQGDITAMDAAQSVEFICVSALPGDYQPSGGSVIAALAAKGVSVQNQSQNKAADYRPTLPCWISQDVGGARLNFKRFLVFEPANPANNAGWDVGMIFQALARYKGGAGSSIALPMVCTGSGGAALSVILRELFFQGATGAGRSSWPVSEVRLVVFGDAEAAKAQFAAMKTQYQNPPFAGGQPGQPPAGMSLLQYQCIKAYTGSAYRALNNALRQRSLTAADYIAYRPTIGMISAGLSNLPDFVGLTLRGANLPPAVIAQYIQGALIVHNDFTSTSWDRPWGGSCLLKITGVTGKKINAISDYPAEDEVLYDCYMTDKVMQLEGAGSEYGQSYQYRFSSNQQIPEITRQAAAVTKENSHAVA